MKYAFLILHYRDIDETVKCINSIIKYYRDSEIVIVDNVSNDGTGERLKSMYSSYNNINVIILDETRGYSYANNLGYQYIKNKFDPDFLIVCNNDIQFIDPDMLPKIEKIYNETSFGVLGPDIYLVRLKEHQSPFRSGLVTLEEMEQEIIGYRKRKNRMKRFKWLYVIGYILQRKFSAFANQIEYITNIRRVRLQHIEMKCDKRQINTTLYGACLIFSRNILDARSKLFWPETMFFVEEDLILFYCMQNGLSVIYEPCIQVTHTCSASTFFDTDRYNKTLWRLDTLIEARKIYIKYVKEKLNQKRENEEGQEEKSLHIRKE